MKTLVLSIGILIGMMLVAKCNGLQERLNSPLDVCRLFPDDAILRKPGSCTETIKCNNGKSMPHSVTCTESKIVKLDKMNCAEDSSKFPDKYCEPTCTKSSPKYIQSVKNCNEWAECNGANFVRSGACPIGQIFKQDEQRCDYEDEAGVCNKTFDICNVAKTNQRFLDENSCNKYFLCNSKRVLIVEQCPISTYYDARTGNCVKKTQVKCYKHPVPAEACGTKKRALLNRFISDQATCSGYFFCRDLGRSQDGNYIPDETPNWGQCPVGQFFDEETESCKSLNNVKCSEDRCDSRNSGNVLAEIHGCQHYLVCKDGSTINEIKCPDNKYFDPVEETCVDKEIWYPVCN